MCLGLSFFPIGMVEYTCNLCLGTRLLNNNAPQKGHKYKISPCSSFNSMLFINLHGGGGALVALSEIIDEYSSL